MAPLILLRTTVVALALFALGGCRPPAHPTPTAEVAKPELPEPASFSNMSPQGGVDYTVSRAGELIERWRPLPFTGDLAPYDPGDFINPAFEELLSKACGKFSGWRETRAFKEPMGEIPTAVATPRGAVLYERVWEKYSESGRITYFGVRVSDQACGTYDRTGDAVVISGDPDVISTLVAAMAIREMDPEADRHELTSRQQTVARELIEQAFTETDPEPAGNTDEKVYSSSEFRALLVGKTKQEVISLLGKPLQVWGGAGGTQVYDYSSDAGYLGHVNFRVADETTGINFRSVQVQFGPSGRVIGVGL